MSPVRHARRAVTGAAVVASVAALAAAPAAGDRTPTAGHGSAYALSAAGPVTVPEVSAVTFNGRPAERSLASTPKNALVSASVLHTNAGKAMSRASVADLAVKKLGLTGNVVTAKCSHGMGHVDLVAAKVHGHKLAVSPAPNSGVSADLGELGTATVTLNKQTRDANGNLTVTAIEARVPVAGKTQTVTISSATCGKAQGSHPAPQKPGPKAPAPTPVHHDLPVTG